MLSAHDIMTSHREVPTVGIAERLQAALRLARSSHDPVFVLNEKKGFEGIVSPGYVVFEKRYPLSTKIKHCLTTPPEILGSTTLPRIATFMLETRLYSLPVFNAESEVIGVVSTPVILERVVKDSALFKKIVTRIKPRRPAILPASASLEEVYHHSRQTRDTRILLTGEGGRLISLITRNDIQTALAMHRKKERFTTHVQVGGGRYGRAEEDVPDVRIPATEFATRNVVTARSDTSMRNVIALMLRRRVPSVVILDRSERPVGIVSTRSVLMAIASLDSAPEIPVLVRQVPLGPVRQYRIENLTAMLERFAQKMQRRVPVRRLEMSIQQPKNPVGKAVAFTVTLKLLLSAGTSYVAKATQFISKTKHVGLEHAVREALRELTSQLDRRHHP